MDQSSNSGSSNYLAGSERGKKSVIGLLAVTITLLLAAAALAASLVSSTETRAELQTLKAEIASLREQRGNTPTASSGPAVSAAQLDELKSLTARLNELAAKLEKPAKEAAETAGDAPAKGAAAPSAATDTQLAATVREAVREEMKAQADKLRGQFANFGGGNRMGGQGGQGGQANPGQGGQGNGGGGPDMTASLKEKAGLDEAKAAEVSKLLAKTREEIRNLYRENNGGGREQNQAKMQELQKKGEEELAKILEPEQLAKVKELIQQSRNRGGGERRGPGRGENRDQPATPPKAPDGQF